MDIPLDLIATYFLYFLSYSVAGWIFETICCSLIEKKFVNRGFMIGPYCPIYGYGLLLVIITRDLLPPMDVPTTFLVSTLICTVFEYLSSVVLEKYYGLRFWDYHDMRFNLNGRVCLRASLLFGFFSMVILYFIHPFFVGLVNLIPENALLGTALTLFLIFAVDGRISSRLTFKFSRNLKDRTADHTKELKKYIRAHLFPFLAR